MKDECLSPLLGASQRHAEDVSSSSDAGVRWIILGYHDFSAGTLSPSQPGLALTGRVEARLLYDLYSVDGGVKLLQKPKATTRQFKTTCGTIGDGPSSQQQGRHHELASSVS